MKWMSLIITCSILLTACGAKGSDRDVHTFSEAAAQEKSQNSATITTTTTATAVPPSIEGKSSLNTEEPTPEPSKSGSITTALPAASPTIPPTVDTPQKQAAPVVEQPKVKAVQKWTHH